MKAIKKDRRHAPSINGTGIYPNKQDAIQFAAQANFGSGRCSKSTLFLVYSTITSLAYDGLHINASQKTIAQRCGLSLRTVKTAISDLRKLGYLFVQHNYRRDKNNQARRITSSMTLEKFRKFLIRKTKSAIQSIGANIAPLFSVNKQTGEIERHRWRFVQEIMENCTRNTIWE